MGVYTCVILLFINISGGKMDKEYEKFIVHQLDDNYSMIHIEIKDNKEFYKSLFNCFFTEDKLIKYAENKFNLKFSPNKVNFTILYKHLKIYLDDFNREQYTLEEIEEEMVKILNEEYTIENKDGKLKVRIDKIGKIGEYIFTCILSEYFKFQCILPKVHLQTSYNMSIYGIDTLFYSEDKKMILFGESKVTKNIENGINLINQSLKEYEKRIKQEYELVLSNRLYRDKLNRFSDMYGDIVDVTLDIEEFIKLADIKNIGIPIFIAHGKQKDIDEIMNKLKAIKRNNILRIKYYILCDIITNHQQR